MRKVVRYIVHLLFPGRRDARIRRARLEWTLSSGIKIVVRNYIEWIIFNDIFVDGEYDSAILRLFTSTGGSLRVLDLGANVGFFTLRLAHLAKLADRISGLEVKAVEASHSSCLQFHTRVIDSQETMKAIKIEVCEGLAGQNAGSAWLHESSLHGLHSVFRKGKISTSVNYIDLRQLTRGWENIDLIKCDIEGSELEFVRNNRDVLLKANAMVIEFHPGLSDATACRQLILEAGLTHHETLRTHDESSVEYFSRS